MSFFDTTPDIRNLDSERIFFENLSEEAKLKALEKKGITDYREANWDIFPIFHHYENINTLSQSEIDDNALMSIGCFQEI